MAEQEGAEKRVVTIKKYANRRLYNTASSSYVTLDHLAQMVKDGVDFVVYDAKTGEDITRSVLTQIIVEEEAKGQHLLPISFLRQLIGFYGDSMQWVVPKYLEHSMQSLAHNQEQMKEYFQNTFGSVFPFASIDAMSKQNMAMFEQAMRMFTPFQSPQDPRAEPRAKDPAQTGAKSGNEKAIDELQSRLDELQRQLGELTGSKKA